MKKALLFAGIRGFRTVIQGLAGVAASVPAVNSFVNARTAGIVAAWGAFGAVVAGLAAFLQNLGERLEKIENE
jgi:hypothetical protein